MIFASSCIESAARELGCTSDEMYRRMKSVNLIDEYILKHYDILHTESRANVTKDIVGCLLLWEDKKGVNRERG